MDLRRTLTKYRVRWADHGPNTSRGWINIQCPLCGHSDPSHHCRINETLTGWYCLRNHAHKGRGLHYLFRLLKIPEEGLPEVASTPREYNPREIDYAPFQYFEQASNSSEMLAYLEQRKFLLPVNIVNRFSLKYSQQGRWAGRLIIPLTAGWTGRSVRSHIEPRYLTETDESGFFLYGKGQSTVLVEGPVDAMKLAAVSNSFLFVAMTGGYLSPSILFTLQDRKVQKLYSVPDNTVQMDHRMALLTTLRTFLPQTQVVNTRLPDQFKDCGEMTEDEARAWLYTL
jgi:hypothetical protein